MIALDTSAFVRYLDGETDRASNAAGIALESGDAYLPPVAFSEILSNPWIDGSALALVSSVPLLKLHEGYWRRAGRLRANLKRSGFKAELPDCLIAQSCLDHDIPLITYDVDFRHFVRFGLKLL